MNLEMSGKNNLIVPEVKHMTLKDLILRLEFEHPIRQKFLEIEKEIPRELIYETPEHDDGYDHIAVWIMMDLIRDEIGVRVE